MAGFENRDEQAGFAMKLWRGERMCLLGFDVDHPEDDFVGFAIEFRAPDMADWEPLKNRLAFSYSQPVAEAVDGNRKFDSTLAPFQKFRWIHFPWQPKAGIYRYRATKMHMPSDERLVAGTSIALDIALDPVAYDGFLDVGFTRNFASSQAYAETFHNRADIIPADPDGGLAFDPAPFQREYEWLGFEARSLMFDFLDRIVADTAVTLDVLAYDFNEPELLQRLERFGPRLRAVIDDSSKRKNGRVTGHGSATSPESQAASALAASAGSGNVRRTHFKSLQHNKIFIARRDGAAFRVLTGSTNFSFRGLYIQANNVLVFDEPAVAKLYAEDFARAFADPGGFAAADIARKWYAVAVPGRPALGFCFSPHKSDALSLNPVAAAVDGATSSVFYAVAFLNQIEAGPTHDAFDRLIGKPVFSYGVVDKRGALEIKKPDGSVGLVDFSYLAAKAPEPFKSEWSGGRGINIHHKFVVTDFNLETAKVFTGSSNLAPSGEKGNGDNLILIEDRKVATAYAIEALRVFDHLHFRSVMQDKLARKPIDRRRGGNRRPAAPAEVLALRKPTAISGKPAWFEPYYQPGSQKERDRELFAS
jgi:phosphatidylserine/phosphatidylglycerophosphate/cardiolipin synthase-like enzyme